MKNLDSIKLEKSKTLQALSAAMKDNNVEGMQEALDSYGEMISEAIMEEVENKTNLIDGQILSTRGTRLLTSEEKKYYDSFIAAASSANPKMEIANIVERMPKTIIESVLGEIPQSHPLLDYINFQNTTGITEMLVNAEGVQTAVWGELNTKITEELEGAFDTFNVMLKKLTAYIPVSKDMLDLGPTWLDRYIREILIEALAVGLETGIVCGNGKAEPIGMCKDVSKEAKVVDGIYPDMEMKSLKVITPESIGAIAAELTKTPAGNNRPLENLVFIVSPNTYLTKVMPATTHYINGNWVNDIMPIPCKIIQSVAVPDNKAVFGLGKRYFMGIGMSKDGKIDYDDSIRWFEDQRVYKIKTYGNGRPLDANAFRYLDISELERFIPSVYTLTTSADGGSNDDNGTNKGGGTEQEVTEY